MHVRVVTRFIAILIFFLGISMGAPLLVSLVYHDGSTRALLLAMLITTCIGFILFLSTKNN